MLWCKSWQIMSFHFPIGDCDMSLLIMIHHERSKLFQYPSGYVLVPHDLSWNAARLSFFGYDNDKDLKVCFLVAHVMYESQPQRLWWGLYCRVPGRLSLRVSAPPDCCQSGNVMGIQSQRVAVSVARHDISGTATHLMGWVKHLKSRVQLGFKARMLRFCCRCCIANIGVGCQLATISIQQCSMELNLAILYFLFQQK